MVPLYKDDEGSEKKLFSHYLETLIFATGKKGVNFLECSYLNNSKTRMREILPGKS